MHVLGALLCKFEATPKLIVLKKQLHHDNFYKFYLVTYKNISIKLLY